MVNSSFLLNNFYTEGFGNIKIDCLQSVKNITDKNLPSVFHTGNIMELKAIDRVISFVKPIFHRRIVTWD